MKYSGIASLLFILLLSGCIGDDFVMDTVDPVLRITNPIDTIGINDSYQFRGMYLNNVGQEETVPKIWTSSDSAVISVDQTGTATAHQLGNAIINARYIEGDSIDVFAEVMLAVGEVTVQPVANERTGTLSTTSTYALSGDFTLGLDGGTLTLAFADNYNASTALPGLYVYLSNNPNTISGAHEIGAVTTFSGAHSYTLPDDIGINDFSHVLYFCKPFNVKVGDGPFDN